MSSVVGYDVSHYDACPSFHDAYNAGFILAIVKATQGVTVVDPKFSGYVQRLRTIEGQLIGAYHFGDASDPTRQADKFVAWAGDIPLLALDWEPNPGSGGTMSVYQAERFAQRVHQVKGKWPMVYCGSLAKESKIGSASPLRQCELWLSQYGPAPVCPPAWSKWRLWQSSGDGVGPEPHDVPGIGQNVDVNRFPGSLDDCRRWYEAL